MNGTLRRLLGLLAPHRRWIALGALLGFLAIGANVALLATSAYLISRSALVTNVAEVALVITAVRVLAIGRATFRYLERYVTHRATFEILTDLRTWFFRSIEPLAPARLAGHRSGDLLARIVGDIETLEDFYVRVVTPPIVAVAVVVFSSVLLGAFDPSLAVVLVVFLTLTGVILPVVSRWLSKAAASDLVPTRAEMSAMLVDEVQGIADLIVLDRAEVHRVRVLALGLELDSIGRRLALVRSATTALAAGLAGLAGLAVLTVGIGLVTSGRLDGVYLAVLPLVAIAGFEIIPTLSQAFQLQEVNEAAARRLFELIDAEPDVVDAPELEAPRALVPGDHGLVIDGLRFGYGADGPKVLDGLDLAVPSGTSLALVGESGAGKSTIAGVLQRFYEFDEGRIAIGGQDIQTMPQDAVRAMLGVVAQDVHLFNATIRDNLALADPDLDDVRMVEACRTAQIHDVIDLLPQGYDTRVGEDGVLLSGGERQRLAIARALLKDAPILILDEATANLDVHTEAAVMQAVVEATRGRTLLVITHRAAVAAHMDRAVTLVDGRVADA